MTTLRSTESTRDKILETALELFHSYTFNGTSLNQIVEAAGITKGALFHYFKGKNDLGYAVVDGPLRSEVLEVWSKPLQNSVDPINDLKQILHGFGEMMLEDQDMCKRGCPLNNLSQEMSNLDETFRKKLLAVYEEWRVAIEKALRAGITAGNVRPDIDPASIATTLVALCEGTIGTIKLHGDLRQLEALSVGIMHFLDSLRP